MAAQQQFQVGPLMTRGAIRSALRTGATRITYYLPKLITLIDADLRDNASLVVALSSICVDQVGGTAGDREAAALVQNCVSGWIEDDLPTEEETLRFCTVQARIVWASCVPDQARWAAADRPGWLTVNPLPADGAAGGRGTAEEIVRVGEWISEMNRHDLKVIKTLTCAVLMYCKQGNATHPVITKVINGIRDSLGHVIHIDQAVLRTAWTMVGPLMNAVKARHIFQQWEDAIGPDCLRLRLLIQQAGWSSMTNFHNIAQAMSLFPRFDWARVRHFMSDEMDAYTAAVALVNGDKFFGYNSDLQEARSTLYPNLSYLAYALLVRVGGVGTLRDFRGVNQQVVHRPLIDDLVQTYSNTLVREQGEVAITPADRNAAAAFLALNPLVAPPPVAAPRNPPPA